MRMVDLLPELAPAARAQWDSLVARLLPWANNLPPPSTLLAFGTYKNIVRFTPTDPSQPERTKAFVNDLARCRDSMLTALVEAGMQGLITGSFMLPDGTTAELRSSHWIALNAGGIGRLEEVINLVADRLTIIEPDGSRITLSGIAVKLRSETAPQEPQKKKGRGRRGIDDSAALKDLAERVANGDTLEKAALLVAEHAAGGGILESRTRRLCDKYRAGKKK
jgi:hypothetical protein